MEDVFFFKTSPSCDGFYFPDKGGETAVYVWVHRYSDRLLAEVHKRGHIQKLCFHWIHLRDGGRPSNQPI